MTVEAVDRDDAVGSRRAAWHQSTLETLLDGCSWQYFLTYELAVPTESKPSSSVGIAYHSAIEQHELARMAGERDGLPLAVMLEHAETTVRADIDDDDLAVAARAAVTNWFSKGTKDGGPSHRDWLLQYKPVAVEPYFNVPLVEGAKPIAGWTDGVYEDENGLFLVDHKTAKTLSRWGHDGDEHRHQATLYSVALALSPEYDIDYLTRMVYMISRTSKGSGKTFEPARRVFVQPDLHDVQVLGDRIRAAEQAVRDRSYVKKPEWVLCDWQWCPFYQECMVTGELAGTPESVAARLGRELR